MDSKITTKFTLLDLQEMEQVTALPTLKSAQNLEKQ